ncbi:hypothetical protein P3L10_031139 [Capsicum annuum]
MYEINGESRKLVVRFMQIRGVYRMVTGFVDASTIQIASLHLSQATISVQIKFEGTC